jgi:hypothetical protein
LQRDVANRLSLSIRQIVQDVVECSIDRVVAGVTARFFVAQPLEHLILLPRRAWQKAHPILQGLFRGYPGGSSSNGLASVFRILSPSALWLEKAGRTLSFRQSTRDR